MNIYKNQKRKKLPKKAMLFFSAVVLVFIVLLTGLIMLFTRGRELSESMTEMPFSADAPHFGVGKNIVYADADTLICSDTSMKKLWQLQLVSGGLDYFVSGDVIVAKGKDIIQVINGSGQHLFSKRLEDGEIASVRACKDKVAVYVNRTVEEAVLSYIIIFDFSGSSIFQIDVSSRYVLDFGFDSAGEALYLLELDVSGSVPVSRISTYRPETQAMTGIKELKDQLVSGLHIVGDQIYTLGTNRLMVYRSLSADTRSVMVYGWSLIDICNLADPRFVYVPSDSTDKIDIARVINGTGNEIKINLPPGVFDILHGGERIYCFANDRIFVYTDEGKYLRAYALPFEIDSVRRAADKHVFITQDKKVYLMPLP